MSSGGAEHQLCELTSGLVERGYDVTVTTFSDIEDHYSLNVLVKRHRIAQYKSNVVKMLSIWKYFFTVNADYVIGFGQRESKFCLIPLLFRLRKRVKAMACERNTDVGEMGRLDFFIRKIIYFRTTFIVTNSEAQKKYIIEKFPQYATKTISISNFTDLNVFKAVRLPNNKKFKIGVFSRYNVQKNCIRFVEAINQLRNKTQKEFTIYWYGDQYIKGVLNPYYLEMRDKIVGYGLENYIVLNNRIRNVAEIMPQFDAICLPSLWEGFSNSIGEAICCGKPLLVSDVADNSVMVKNGINGFLFNPIKVDEIVNSFLHFFSLSIDERQQMGNMSRRIAEKLFNRDRYIDSYINLIES